MLWVLILGVSAEHEGGELVASAKVQSSNAGSDWQERKQNPEPRVFGQGIMLYRKLPLISPGIIKLRKGF